MSKFYEKFGRSFSKIIFPLLFKLFSSLRINRRAINYFSEKGYFLNNKQNFYSLISNLLNQKKIITLDVGAQGGFNSDEFILNKYNSFFEPILVEPIKEEAEQLKKNHKYVIDNALWSSKTKKEIFILGNRLGSSSMYEPDSNFFDIHKIKKENYKDFEVTKKIEVSCETLNSSLENLNINKIDYLKIDTQGAELEILKGIGNYKPLLIRIESHIHSMYKDVPSWNELLNHLYKLNYVVIDWKGIGSHATRVPAEMDMIFIPNFNSDIGKKLILENENKFVSLMLMFGQISLLKIISSKNNFKSSSKIENLNDSYFN
jgi:FkbM family methyltransferase|tara:strand:+ start:787 stop:1737 length:951 start_codon:yes stop_codon:yes gene_type:complete